MKVTFYEKPNGKHPVAEFIDKLPKPEQSRITGCLASIELMGFDTPRVQFRQIRGALWEIKIRTSRSSYRIFYVCTQKRALVLLHAYKKQSQKAPKKEIEVAEKRMLEVLHDEHVNTH